jgi:hypothetical protein
MIELCEPSTTLHGGTILLDDNGEDRLCTVTLIQPMKIMVARAKKLI